MSAVIAAPPVAELIESTHLRYVCDTGPGVRRVPAGKHFRYLDAKGQPIRDAATLARIQALAIPPAWTDVWICPAANGHIQATGRDARGRKQYRYHARWRAARDGTKFDQLTAFGAALPDLRARVADDLKQPGLPRAKVLATVVRLLDLTHLRVGNAEYVRANKSFGLSTLLDRHVRFSGAGVTFKFRGKSGVWHEREVGDRRLARIVRHCRDLPGQDLFQYLDEAGEQHAVGSADVNEYIRATAGGEFTAKVFRTWAGTVEAAVRLADRDPPTKKAAVEVVKEVVKEVAAHLGNTPAVCRNSYIHPTIIEAYLGGALCLKRPPRPPRGLNADESAVLRFLTDL